MITIEKIQSLIADKLTEGDYFVVSLDVSPNNQIKLVVDSMQGITIEECVAFSRAIEHNLDREEEDFELEVTSPGLSMPLLVQKQYEKNIGRELDITLNDGNRFTALLNVITDSGIQLTEKKRVKVEGKKKKQAVEEEHTIKYADIKKALIVIKF
jgi:ribosome maturation factor RimP